MTRTTIAVAVLAVVLVAGCGSSDDTSPGNSSGGSGGTAGSGGSGGSTGGVGGVAGSGASGGAAGASGSGGAAGGGGAAGQGGSGAVLPVGVSGNWTLAFDDEFDGSSLDSAKWTTMDGGGWGSATCKTANVAVSGGNLVLTLASSSSGGCVCTGSACAPAFGGSFKAGAESYDLPVGGFAEARVNFPGSGEKIYNWPAWWTSGPGWPAAGEHDIAEGCGTLTVNYHSPSGAHNFGTISGTWSNAFHVYGMHCMASSVDVYYDGQKVKSYPTDDNGKPHSLILDLTEGCGGTPLYGAGSEVLIDYVRAWE